MNLFNYLMARKGHNTSPRDDLFAYLLGKVSKVVKEVTGVTIHITDVTRQKIISLWLDKESTQDGTPTPDNPVPVEVVEGYIKDGNNYVDVTVEDGNGNSNVVSIPLNGNFIGGIGDYKDTLMVDKSGKCYLNKNTIKIILDGINQVFDERISTSVSGKYRFTSNINGIVQPASNNNIPIIMCDKLIKQTVNRSWNNHQGISINPGTSYVIVNLPEIEEMDKNQANDWLKNNNLTCLLALKEPNLIDLNYTIDLKLFKGENNISNSEDMMMTLKYY